MRVTGIIAEYNPFHRGHEYHIEQARSLSRADYCVAVMSGDFVQRGEPAIFSKYLRAKAALSCGADLVLEIPAVFATGSAEDFGACGVALLTGLGVVDTLCFGSECGDTGLLMEAARYLQQEPADYSSLLREGMKCGLTWPQARSRALEQLECTGSGAVSKGAADALKTPNNILGLEYCKAILKQGSPLEPLAVLRKGSGYHDESLKGEMASASAIRRRLRMGRDEGAGTTADTDSSRAGGPAGADVDLSAHVPDAAMDIFREALPIFPDDLSLLLNYALLSGLQEGRNLADYEGMNKELEDRLQKLLLSPQGWEGRIRQLKTRQYTYTRISRGLLHVLLGITAGQTGAGRAMGYGPYARVLGFRRSAAPLLSAIKAAGRIPLVTKTADARQLLTGEAMAMLDRDFYCTHLWQAAYFQKYGQAMNNEFTQPVTVL